MTQFNGIDLAVLAESIPNYPRDNEFNATGWILNDGKNVTHLPSNSIPTDSLTSYLELHYSPGTKRTSDAEDIPFYDFVAVSIKNIEGILSINSPLIIRNFVYSNDNRN